jgi:formate C-acetyltransferase
MGRQDIAQTLARVPARPARTFREGLQTIRFCHAILWLSGHYQIGLGRFDQYLWPYLQADLRARRLTRAEAEELVAEFFLSLNKDTDLYFGKRSNGQTLMLGGVRRDGRSGVNDLTFMALRAARDVGLVDPKINLRIGPDTDLELLSLASELTRQGLGFPQYSNDAVVIPALVNHGYEIGDARDYSVAACWEFIIPGKGMEVVNVGAVSFPAAVDQALRDGLSAGDRFDGMLARVRSNIQDLLRQIVEPYRRLILPPAPFLSVLMDGCVERGRDLSCGLKYNNFGVHGACSANAADALAAVRRFVFEEKSVAPDELLAALESNFEGHEALRQKLCEEAPKVGNNDPAADEMLLLLFDALADACAAYGENGRGGIVRPGSGSAMYYLWLARGHAGLREPVVSATADGRKKGDFFSSSLSPSLNARVRGPLSMLQSFAKIDYGRICNGGPITLNLSATVFRGRDSLRKTGMLVRTFAQLGCQQLQVDVVSRDTLLAAKAHPERYRNLVVRVWGWSGYFCELDPLYQEHVIARHEFAMN